MSADRWAAISFGVTLALVVGLRLSVAGLLLVGTLLLLALLLCPLFAARAVERALHAPQVRVERPMRGLAGAGVGVGNRPLLVAQPRPSRRGGWPHLGQGSGERVRRVAREERTLAIGDRR